MPPPPLAAWRGRTERVGGHGSRTWLALALVTLLMGCHMPAGIMGHMAAPRAGPSFDGLRVESLAGAYRVTTHLSGASEGRALAVRIAVRIAVRDAAADTVAWDADVILVVRDGATPGGDHDDGHAPTLTETRLRGQRAADGALVFPLDASAAPAYSMEVRIVRIGALSLTTPLVAARILVSSQWTPSSGESHGNASRQGVTRWVVAGAAMGVMALSMMRWW